MIGMAVSKTDPVDHFVLWDPTTLRVFYFREPAHVANHLLAKNNTEELPPPTCEDSPTLRFFSAYGAVDLTRPLSEWRRDNAVTGRVRNPDQAARRKALAQRLHRLVQRARLDRANNEPGATHDQ